MEAQDNGRSGAAMSQLFQINCADNGYDALEAISLRDGITISIENPWAGSTDTGFGYTCSIRISPKQAEEFGRWLCEQARKVREP